MESSNRKQVREIIFQFRSSYLITNGNNIDFEFYLHVKFNLRFNFFVYYLQTVNKSIQCLQIVMIYITNCKRKNYQIITITGYFIDYSPEYFYFLYFLLYFET